jgi:hypothetical protein
VLCPCRTGAGCAHNPCPPETLRWMCTKYVIEQHGLTPATSQHNHASP